MISQAKNLHGFLACQGLHPLDPWGLHLKSLQIISLIRSAFDGNVTFVFSYIEINDVMSMFLDDYTVSKS